VPVEVKGKVHRKQGNFRRLFEIRLRIKDITGQLAESISVRQCLLTRFWGFGFSDHDLHMGLIAAFARRRMSVLHTRCRHYSENQHQPSRCWGVLTTHYCSEFFHGEVYFLSAGLDSALLDLRGIVHFVGQREAVKLGVSDCRYGQPAGGASKHESGQCKDARRRAHRLFKPSKPSPEQ